MFGIRYDLLCYEQSDLDELKRARIVAEFDNGEFSGESGGDYAYDLFEMPTGKADRVGTAIPRRATPPPASPIEESVHAVNVIPRKRKQFQRPDNGPLRCAAEALAYEKRLPEDLKPEPRIAEAYPVQFDPKVFSQAGFLYAVPESINFNPKKNYSLEELKEACQNFPLEGWQEWSTRPKEKFMRWMLNEMGAFMSLARGDPLEPMEGLATGFEQWKKYQVGGHSPRRTPRKIQKTRTW